MSYSPSKNFSKLLEFPKTTKKDQHGTYSYDSHLHNYELSSATNELRIKLDLALKHNSRLLDENNNLSDIVNQLRYEVKAGNDKAMHYQRESEDILRKTALQRENLSLQVQTKQKMHDTQLQKLLREISLLHQQKQNLELDNAKTIEVLKTEMEQAMFQQMQALRNCQNNSKELYEANIANLKELIDKGEKQIEQTKALDRLQRNRLNDHIKSLESEVKHIKATHAIELQGIKNSHDNQLHCERKKLENEKEIEVSTYDIRLRRVKKELLEKNMQLQHLGKKVNHQEQIVAVEGAQFKKEKEKFLAELKSNDLHSKNMLTREKNKAEELNRLEVENITKLYNSNVEELQSQKQKLKLLIEAKTNEMKSLYESNTTARECFIAQTTLLRKQNDEFRARLKQYELHHKEQLEAFKIKVSTLMQNDITALSNYYETQLNKYIEANGDLQKINVQIKGRLYSAIQDNDQIRKNFELELSKQKAKVQDLKIKLASQVLEHKEHVSNLGSKIQLTSQTLIREAEHKSKSKTQYDEEKRKFHHLVNAKDKQISDLLALMETLKSSHEKELKAMSDQKIKLKLQKEQVMLEAKRIKESAEDIARQKEQRMKNLVFDNEKELQEIKELEDKNEVLEKNNIKLKKQVEHLTMLNQSIAQELGLSKGFIENLQMESSAAIEDERNKLKTFTGSHQLIIKGYFEDKLKSREKDVEMLQKLLFEKEEDIRDLIVKYNALQKRLQLMMETQAKLSDMEEKIKCLGLDTSLIQSMAQLFKNR